MHAFPSNTSPIYGEKTTALMRDLTGDLKPFPRPRVTSVVVGGRRIDARAARTYLRLFEQRRESRLAEPPYDWIRIDLRSAVGSPWTDGEPDLMYSPRENLLENGWMRVDVASELADDIEARRPLGEPSRRSWRAWLGAGAGTALLALGALLMARRVDVRLPKAP